MCINNVKQISHIIINSLELVTASFLVFDTVKFAYHLKNIQFVKLKHSHTTSKKV